MSIILAAILIAPVPAEPPPAIAAEIRCEDGSTLFAEVLDANIEITTRYGKLKIPAADIRSIEFATRTPADQVEKIAAAIKDLDHPDYESREKASAYLRGCRGRAYHQALKATRSSSPEVAMRATAVCDHIRARAKGTDLEIREADVIHTGDSRISGQLVAVDIRVNTVQFGEQRVRLADMVSIRFIEPLAEQGTPAPVNLTGYAGQKGKRVTLLVTGAQPGAPGANVWGSGTYTLDSNLAAAAVHAGFVEPGKTATLRVRIVESPVAFVGSTMNGVTSNGYGRDAAGAFEFER